MTLISDALAIASAGWPVFPCGATKHPAIAKTDGGQGFHDATLDADIARSLFQHRHAKLIGVPTGEASGFDVLDLDYRHGAKDWEDANKHRLPETRIHQTMSGGRHMLFRHVHGIRNSASKFAPGMDVRGEGGYVIVPPSVGYTVISDAEIADWPDWLLEIILARPVAKDERPTARAPLELSSKRLEGLTRAILSRVSAAAPGGKHFALRNAALSLGGILDISGMTEAQAADRLVGALPDGVLDWNGARATAIWGLQRGRERPLSLDDRPEHRGNGHATAEEPPPEPDDPSYWNSVELDAQAAPEIEPEPAGEADPTPPSIIDPWNALRPVAFPIHAVPPVLRELVEDRARIIGADPCAIAWTCLSACSAALDGRIRLQMKRHDNWTVPPAIWVALIGAPSTKKTPIMDTAWAPLHRAQAHDLSRHQREMAEWNATPKAQRNNIPEPTMPRRLVSHDATMEALQEILAKQDRGIGVLRDELAGWIGAMEKYAPGKGGAADRAFALQSYNGVAHVVDRIGRGTLPINNLLTTMCGGIQPDRLRQFGDLTDDGLWQRFVPVIVASASIGVDEAASGTTDAYAEMVHRLLLVPSTIKLHLSDEGHAIREEVQRRIFNLEQSEVLGSRFVGFCGKLVGLWGRLALVLHFMVNQDGNTVSGRTADAARSLLFRSILPNAARVYTAMGGAGGDIEATQSIAGYVLTKKLRRLVVSDLTSNVRVCRHKSLDDVRKLLSPLEAGGWLFPEKEYNATAWMVNDHVHARFADRAARETRRREQVRALITASLGDGDEG